MCALILILCRQCYVDPGIFFKCVGESIDEFGGFNVLRDDWGIQFMILMILVRTNVN